MMTIEACVKDRAVSFPETVIHIRDHDFAGEIHYEATVKNAAALGSITVRFRWKDRRGVVVGHEKLGLSLALPGVIAADRFSLWTQYAVASTVTLEIVVVPGLNGAPVFDFFCNGWGNQYGA
jgi:hypothetical protein